MVMKNLFAGHQWRNRQKYRPMVVGEGRRRGRDGDMYDESNMEIYITMCK